MNNKLEDNIWEEENLIEQSKKFENSGESVNKDSIVDMPNKKENENSKNIIKNEELIKRGTVYLITNLTNNKKYVGITIRSIEIRFREHLRDAFDNKRISHNKPICNAIRKYGKEKFKIELIEEFNNITQDFLLDRESINIDKYDTFIDNGKGYNLIKKSTQNLIYSKLTREKLHNNSIGNKNPFYGKKHNKNTKKILSELAKKKTGNKNPFYDKHPTKESIEKRLNTFKKNYKKENHPMFGRHHTKESKRKMSKRQKGLYLKDKNPAYDKKIYIFKNIETNEEFVGTQYDFRNKFKLKASTTSSLIHRRISLYKKWKLL